MTLTLVILLAAVIGACIAAPMLAVLLVREGRDWFADLRK